MMNGWSNVLVVSLEEGVEFQWLFGDQHAKGTEHAHMAVLEPGFTVLFDELPIVISKAKWINTICNWGEGAWKAVGKGTGVRANDVMPETRRARKAAEIFIILSMSK
jgi:hypothetical protein